VHHPVPQLGHGGLGAVSRDGLGHRQCAAAQHRFLGGQEAEHRDRRAGSGVERAHQRFPGRSAQHEHLGAVIGVVGGDGAVTRQQPSGELGPQAQLAFVAAGPFRRDRAAGERGPHASPGGTVERAQRLVYPQVGQERSRHGGDAPSSWVDSGW
jgi:hypothetical protein